MTTETIFDEDELRAAAVTSDEGVEGAQGAPEAQGSAEAGADGSQAQAGAEGAPAGSEAGDEGGDQPTTVPHAALHAERERRKKIEAELQSERVARERERARLDAIEAMLRPKEEAPKPLPPITDDPLAHIQHIGQTTAELRQMFEQQQQAQAEAQAHQVLVGTLEQAEQAFRSSAPDYDAAAEHLYASRIQELKMLGVPDQQIERTIQSEIFQMTQHALQSGRNPAELFYETAKVRGYRAGGAPAQQQGQPDPAAKVAAMNAGQAAGKSLGAVPGSAPATDLNIKALLEMSDDEFAKIDPAQFRRVAGG